MPGFNIPQISVGCHDDNAFTEPPAFAGADFAIESARKHRYKLELMQTNGTQLFGDDASGILLYCYKASRPSPELDEIVIHNGQDEIYRPGKNRWKPINLTFYETLGGDLGNFYDNCTELMYNWWSSIMLDLQTSSHAVPENYLARGQLSMLDGVGNSVWNYHLLDCWPVKVEPSELSYASTDIADTSVTLRFQKAVEGRV